MEQPATVGIDLARNLFQLRGVDAGGVAIRKRKLRRSQGPETLARRDPCRVRVAACAGARDLQTLGHEVRIMPPARVKRGKTGETAGRETVRRSVR